MKTYCVENGSFYIKRVIVASTHCVDATIKHNCVETTHFMHIRFSSVGLTCKMGSDFGNGVTELCRMKRGLQFVNLSGRHVTGLKRSQFLKESNPCGSFRAIGSESPTVRITYCATFDGKPVLINISQ